MEADDTEAATWAPCTARHQEDPGARNVRVKPREMRLLDLACGSFSLWAPRWAKGGSCHLFHSCFPGSSVGEESARSAGDTRDAASTLMSGTSCGEGDGSPLQHSCLESSMDRGPAGLQRMRLHRIRLD